MKKNNDISTSPIAKRLFRERLNGIRSHLLAPPPNLRLSEWADQNRYIGYNAPEPGQWRTLRAPYQQAILDAAGDASTKRMVLMAAAQTGKTSILENVIAYYMVNDPSPIMLVMPDKASADSFSVTKLEPMIEATPVLRRLVASKRKRDGGNKKLEKVFPGGYITMVSAKSAHSLRARSIRILLLDEIDAYEASLAEEGDPVQLAEARTSNFANRKIIMCSTPTVKDFSRVEKEYLKSNQQHFHLPCPLCGEYQQLRWGGAETDFGIKWDDDNPDTTRYRCSHCHQDFPESHKLQMMLKGHWLADNPEADIIGFHISALYSPWVSWSELVSKWLSVKNRPDQQQEFVNLKLGEPWEDKTHIIELGELASRVHDYDAPCPSGVGILTCGVDVQQDWIEASVWGFGKGEEMWQIDTIQLVGPTSQPDVWLQLSDVLRQTYETINKVPVPITITLIDTGFQTDMVYRQVKTYAQNGIRIVPIKGFEGARSIFEFSRFKTPGKPKLGMVGVSQAKGLLYARLKNVHARGPGYIHFPAGTHQEVLDQILSERQYTIYNKGNIPKQIWKQIRERNEQLDCMVYAYAGYLASNPAIHTQIDALVDHITSLQMADGQPAVVKDGQVQVQEPPKRQQLTIPIHKGGLLRTDWLR